jgi:hypothetical protein
MSLAPLGRRLGKGQLFRHVEPDLAFDNLSQSDICRTQIGDIGHQRTAHSAGARSKLAHAARNQIDQNVGIATLRQGLFAKFAIQETQL